MIFTLKGLDCMLRPDMCGPNSSCKETNKKVATQWIYHQCVCNPGFVGNGITCIDATDLANGDSFSFETTPKNICLNQRKEVFFTNYSFNERRRMSASEKEQPVL